MMLTLMVLLLLKGFGIGSCLIKVYEKILDMIRTINAPHQELGANVVCWFPESKAEFTIKSVYEEFYDTEEVSGKPFKKICQLKLLQHLRTFTWLLMHNALLTNKIVIISRGVGEYCRQQLPNDLLQLSFAKLPGIQSLQGCSKTEWDVLAHYFHHHLQHCLKK
ncbi:hypothetical protein AHAS_Ahas05G0116500 [Arachis hypogaea]